MDFPLTVCFIAGFSLGLVHHCSRNKSAKKMLTDTQLKKLKPTMKAYKISDRDGLYATVLTTGTISFRYNYRINGRQETIVLGCYGVGGITLAEAREKLVGIKKDLKGGISPTRQKARDKQKQKESGTFGEWAKLWIQRHTMADSTRDMRISVFERDLKNPFGRLQMGEITHQDLRRLCTQIVERGAPATAVHAREIVHMVYRFANEQGHKFENPADEVRPCSIATFQSRTTTLWD
ncbi:tyrosine-type recombinase/integrase [Chitinimonas sp. PSY-7]|uniref:integrase arm-type DNA-binding domain-containing protein n=1 Tax=Chitinimonas sp. PSY-7 TaxID=3459088 RepID=UPI00403FF821